MSAPHATAPYDVITAEARALLFRTAHYLTAEDQENLEKACAYAFYAHDGQTRKSGEPYITHPIAVTIELAKWHMDSYNRLILNYQFIPQEQKQAEN